MADKRLQSHNAARPRRRFKPPLRLAVNPYYIGGLGVLVASVFVVWSYFGFSTFRSTLLEAADRQGRALLESLVQATEVTAQANQYIRLQQIQILSDKAALDVRVRNNLVMGELRPFELWGVKKTFPFNLIDVGVGLKGYF